MRRVAFLGDIKILGLILLVYTSTVILDENVPNFELAQATMQFKKGEEQINRLMQKAMMPTGSCWKQALEDLQISCKGMKPDQQSRLAFQFTICYNELLGLPSVVCDKFTPIQECMKHLSGTTQSTFRDFFMQTQDMCQYLEQQLWLEKTSHAVNEVTHAIVDVSKNLEETREIQKDVLESQQESLLVQSNIKKDNTEIYNMVTNVKEVFQDVQASAVEQRQVVIDVFEKLSKMQKLVSWIQGEMSLLDMMGFYFACILFGFFGTSSKRTQGARFWIVFLMISTIGFERSLFNCLNAADDFTPEMIQEYVWLLRRFGALLGVIIIICSAAIYRDPQIVQGNQMILMNHNMSLMMAQLEKIDNLETAIRNLSPATSTVDLPRLSNQEVEISDDDDDEDDDFDESFSDYEDGEKETVTKRVKSQSKSNSNDPSTVNDENKVPEADAGVITKLFRSISKRAVRSRERSTDRSLTGSNHNYNLRIRNGSASPALHSIPESTSRYTKPAKPVQNTTMGYYSSDEDF